MNQTPEENAFRKRQQRTGICLLLGLLLFGAWFASATNYDYSAFVGTYHFDNSGVTSTLVLKADRTFHQNLSSNGQITEADGTWRRIGEGGVDFSFGFLRLPGARTALEEWPDSSADDPAAHTYFGRFKKVLGIYPELDINSNPPGPIYYKQFFR